MSSGGKGTSRAAVAGAPNISNGTDELGSTRAELFEAPSTLCDATGVAKRGEHPGRLNVFLSEEIDCSRIHRDQYINGIH